MPGGTVTVASRLPFDLYLDLVMEDPTSPGSNQPYPRKRIGIVRGFAREVAVVTDKRPAPLLSNGFALTPGIPEDDWNAWLKQHDQDPMVLNGHVFAQAKMENAQAKTRDEAQRIAEWEASPEGKLTTSMVPIDPNNPGRGLERVRSS